MSSTFILGTSDEYIKRKYCKDLSKAVTELIWNSLDANADIVKVTFEKGWLFWADEYSVVQNVIIEDNGDWIDFIDIEGWFRHLWKSSKFKWMKNRKGRFVHGKNGEWRAYTIGLWWKTTWQSVYCDKIQNKHKEFSIDNTNSLRNFSVSELQDSDQKTTWVTVKIRDLSSDLSQKFDIQKFKQDLLIEFAHYLKTYEKDKIQIIIDWGALDIANALASQPKELNFSARNPADNNSYAFKLAIYHWKDRSVHARYFVNSDFSIIHEDGNTWVARKDFWHSVYISGQVIEDMSNVFQLFTSDVFFSQISDAIKQKIEEHYREYFKKEIAPTIDNFKKEGIYPYKDAPLTPIEKDERAVFDACLFTISANSEKFHKDSSDSKKIVLNLLKEAIERDAKSIIPIFQSVLNLPKDEIDDLIQLIDEYSLSYVIKLSRIITDKLSLIEELGLLIQDPSFKGKTLERKHLHKILERELWIFWDGYTEWTSDRTMKDVLKTHIKLLWREDLIDEEVLNWISSDRPDLFIFRQYPQTRESHFEHLIVELKRPSLKLTSKELWQIEDYALQVAEDARFEKETVKWKFILIGDEVDPSVRSRITQRWLPEWCSMMQDHFEVWVYNWAKLLQNLRWKYQFLKQKLEDESSKDPKNFDYLKRIFPEITKEITE